MRARFINEVNFQRGRDPKQAIGIGTIANLEAEAMAQARKGRSWDNATPDEKGKLEIAARKEILPKMIRAQRFEDAEALLEQPDKVYKTRIKQAIVDLVWGAGDKRSSLAECHKRQDKAIEFMPYLISKGAIPKFRGWSAYKDSCEFALSKFMKKFIDEFHVDPHMGGEMPMRRLVEENIKYYSNEPEMLERIWESMQVLLDNF